MKTHSHTAKWTHLSWLFYLKEAFPILNYWQSLAALCHGPSLIDVFTAAAHCSPSESERKANVDVGVAFVRFLMLRVELRFLSHLRPDDFIKYWFLGNITLQHTRSLTTRPAAEFRFDVAWLTVSWNHVPKKEERVYKALYLNIHTKHMFKGN